MSMAYGKIGALLRATLRFGHPKTPFPRHALPPPARQRRATAYAPTFTRLYFAKIHFVAWECAQQLARVDAHFHASINMSISESEHDSLHAGCVWWLLGGVADFIRQVVYVSFAMRAIPGAYSHNHAPERFMRLDGQEEADSWRAGYSSSGARWSHREERH